MIAASRRIRARASVVAPSTKERLLALSPRRRSQVAFLDRRLAQRPEARVLGVGKFDPVLRAALVARLADIADHRPANRAANILADLWVDGRALAGPYDLIVAQEVEFTDREPRQLVGTLLDVLAIGGSLLIVARSSGQFESAVRSVEPAHVEASRIRSNVVALEVTVR